MKKAKQDDEIIKDFSTVASADCIKINGTSTDVGLYNHVFDGTDDAYDIDRKNEALLEGYKKELKETNIGLYNSVFDSTDDASALAKLKDAIKSEMKKRGLDHV